MQNTQANRNWISTEWRFILSVVSPVIAVMLTWFSLQTKVELIQQKVNIMESNHLAHIQTSLDRMADSLDSLAKQQIETRTILNSHINAE